jgi:hypothetical protein
VIIRTLSHREQILAFNGTNTIYLSTPFLYLFLALWLNGILKCCGDGSFFLSLKIATALLTYFTKLNLTTKILLKLGYCKTYNTLNKKMEKLASGNAILVTENIVSAHISNICLLIGGLMFVIVDRLISARLMMTQLMKQNSSSLALS